MKTISYIATIAATSFGLVTANAQTSNFSQYHLTPVYTSPAESGMTDDFQVLTHYRKQSLAGDQGYEKVSLSGMFPLHYKDGRRFGGVALGIANERSGMLGIFRQQNVKAGYAYDFQASRAHHVSVGIHAGYYRTSLALDNIRTDAQYQDGAYDPGNGIGETFSDGVSQAFRIDAGATWYAMDPSGSRMFALGFAAFNVNGAGYQFTAGGEERQPTSYQLYGSWRAYVHDRLEIIPTFRYLREKNFDQLNLGSLFLYQINADDSNIGESQLGMGVWYSLNNAAIVSLQWTHPSYLLSISHDISASSDIQQGQVNNGVEVTLGWRVNRSRLEKSAR